MSIPLHCRVKERTKLDSKTEYKTYKNYLTMEHYDRIAVVRYLDKLRKIEGCILLNSKLEICKDYMKEDGSLYLVINKDQGAKSLKKDLEECYNVTTLKKNKGFYVFKCQIR